MPLFLSGHQLPHPISCGPAQTFLRTYRCDWTACTEKSYPEEEPHSPAGQEMARRIEPRRPCVLNRGYETSWRTPSSGSSRYGSGAAGHGRAGTFQLPTTPSIRSSQIFPRGSSDVSYAFVNSRHSASPADIRVRNTTADYFVVSVLRRGASSNSTLRLFACA
jgi:hypothetical protein